MDIQQAHAYAARELRKVESDLARALERDGRPDFPDGEAALRGMTTGEIAQLLGESPGTLRSHLSRARKALKLRLEAEGYGPS